jgi:hypothetical protein
VKIAIFPLRLLLFYIVYNAGKSRKARAQPRPQQSLSRKKENHYESDDEWDGLTFRSFFVCSCSGSKGFGGEPVKNYCL